MDHDGSIIFVFVLRAVFCGGTGTCWPLRDSSGKHIKGRLGSGCELSRAVPKAANVSSLGSIEL